MRRAETLSMPRGKRAAAGCPVVASKLAILRMGTRGVLTTVGAF